MSKPEGKRPPPPDEFDENPELTDEFFENALPWKEFWKVRRQAMRETAAELRRQADLLDEKADALEGMETPAAAE